MITEKRLELLYSYWCSETNDPESEEWRDDLTAEEYDVVDDWDRHFDTGMLSLYSRIVELNTRRKE